MFRANTTRRNNTISRCLLKQNAGALPSNGNVYTVDSASMTPDYAFQEKSFELLFDSSMELSYIWAYCKRYVNRFRPKRNEYYDLFDNEALIEYFKRYYPLQRLTKIEGFLERSSLYKKSHMDRIHMQTFNTRSVFLEACKSAQILMERMTRCKLNKNLHFLGLKCVYEDIFGGRVSDIKPRVDQVLAQINFSASGGLPDVWVKKRDSRVEISNIISQIINGTFNLETYVRDNPKVVPITAAFLRNQITDNNLKTRLVFAVAYVLVVPETYFNLKSKIHIDSFVGSRAIHGYTQIDLSKRLVEINSGRHTLCIDYKGFDQRVPMIVLASCFSLLSKVLQLNSYERALFLASYSYSLVMPVFHPALDFIRKNNGLVSGSGYTSRIGSMANYFMLSVVMYLYCKENGIRYDRNKFVILVSSDDTNIASDFKINFVKFAAILKRVFNMEIELEHYSPPSSDECYFLGSKWVKGLPYRNCNRLLARILFGNGNYPKMTDLELFQSRCYEILGNTCEFSKIYETFKVPVPNRVFRTLELSDYVTRTELKKLMDQSPNKDNRGVWQNLSLKVTDLDEVWKTR